MLHSPLSILLLASVSFQSLLCFLSSRVFSWITGWSFAFFLLFSFFLLFPGVSFCYVGELWSKWLRFYGSLGFWSVWKLIEKWDWFLSIWVVGFGWEIANWGVGDPSFEFCCRRVLFYLGEVENWHLNKIFGQFCLRKLKFCTQFYPS